MRAGIALGSNIEPRLLNLQAARQRIFEITGNSGPALASKVYETSPVDCLPGTAAFLNAVLEIETDLAPDELHVALQRIETDLGRPAAHEKNSPRTIDLDLLYCGDHVVNTPVLTLPHPRIAERRFVLQPLADVRPNLQLPNFRKNVLETLHDLRSDEILSEYCLSIH